MKRLKSRHQPQCTQWPDSLLRGLRVGKLRIPALALRPGLNFSQLREGLRRLSPEQCQALSAGLQGQVQQPSAVSVKRQRTTGDALLASQIAHLRSLPAHPEAVLLDAAGRDRFGRQHWLQPVARRAWGSMRDAAKADGISLELVSSFRSVADQNRILARKLRQGQSLQDILRVNAPPGYSEHHTGCAIDLAVPGEPVLTEAFEGSPAFAWLLRHASRFGFRLSYPRANPFGFVYEPWHWCFRGAPDSSPEATESQLSTTGP